MCNRSNIRLQNHILFLILCLFLTASVAHGVEPAYELGFSPNGKSLQVVLHGISSAKESVLVAAYSLPVVCGIIGHTFMHHDALEDSKAAGALILAAGRETGLTLAAWLKKEAL